MTSDLSDRADEAGETDNAAISEQLSDFRGASNILLEVIRTEPEVTVDSVPNVVRVQTVRRNAFTYQVLLNGERDRSLPRAEQACHQ